jgi:hypothetical protein
MIEHHRTIIWISTTCRSFNNELELKFKTYSRQFARGPAMCGKNEVSMIMEKRRSCR